jgi:hypothetical protein
MPVAFPDPDSKDGRMMHHVRFSAPPHDVEYPTEATYTPRAKQLVVKLNNGSHYTFTGVGPEGIKQFHTGPYVSEPDFILNRFLKHDYPWKLYSTTGQVIDQWPKHRPFYWEVEAP